MDNRFSFKKGWNQLPQAIYGKCEPKVSEAQAIEEIFHSYGITDIWGD